MGALMVILCSFLCVIICHYHKKYKKIRSIVSYHRLSYLLCVFV